MSAEMLRLTETDVAEQREQTVRELRDFTAASRRQLDRIFDSLGWSQQHPQEDALQCPYDSGHRVALRNLEKHKVSCALRQKGYSTKEQAEMVDPSSSNKDPSGVRSFIMDESTQQQVILRARSAAPMMKMEGIFWQGQYSGQPVDVPQNHKRALCDLTVADRLALYNHVMDVFGQQREAATTASAKDDDLYEDLVSKLQKDEEQQEPKTHLELMAEMRDYKRRRQSYRAKNVHITKKSYTEVIREVISVHSEELSRHWRQEEDEEPEAESSSSHRRVLDGSRSASPESGVSRSRRCSRERSHNREKKRTKRERDSRSPSEHGSSKKKKKKKKKKREEEER